MSANSLDEMLCEWEKLAKEATPGEWANRTSKDGFSSVCYGDGTTHPAEFIWQKSVVAGDVSARNGRYIAHANPAFALSLSSLVRAALAPRLPVEELPERPKREHVKQFETALTSMSYVQWAEFVRYADALESEVARLREERDEATDEEETPHDALRGNIFDFLYADENKLFVEDVGFRIRLIKFMHRSLHRSLRQAETSLANSKAQLETQEKVYAESLENLEQGQKMSRERWRGETEHLVANAKAATRAECAGLEEAIIRDIYEDVPACDIESFDRGYKNGIRRYSMAILALETNQHPERTPCASPK